jgi:hypothetical protein
MPLLSQALAGGLFSYLRSASHLEPRPLAPAQLAIAASLHPPSIGRADEVIE